MGRRRKARVHAFQALYSWEISRPPIDKLVEFSWVSDRSEDWQAFARLLVAGTIENIEHVDELIKGQLEHWDFERISKVDLAILRVSVYAIVYQPDIPSSVTIDEAVELSRQFSSEESYRFINGLLDGIRKVTQ
jgi:N utilization substance protein B